MLSQKALFTGEQQIFQSYCEYYVIRVETKIIFADVSEYIYSGIKRVNVINKLLALLER